MCSRNGRVRRTKLTSLLHHYNVPRSSLAVDMCTLQKTERRLENWSYKLKAKVTSPLYRFLKILKRKWIDHTEILRQGRAGQKIWRSYIWICQCRKNCRKRVANASYVKTRYSTQMVNQFTYGRQIGNAESTKAFMVVCSFTSMFL